MSAEIIARGWALRRADGSVVADFLPGVTEADIWKIALGWPPPDEIEDQKRKGACAYWVELHVAPPQVHRTGQ